MGQLSKFALFQKCIEKGVEIDGNLVCRNAKPYPVQKDDFTFFSPSGNYKIDIELNSSNNISPVSK